MLCALVELGRCLAGPRPLYLVSSLGWLLPSAHPRPEIQINPLTLAPGRSGSTSALPSSVPVPVTPRSEPVPLRHQTSSLPSYPPLVTTSLPSRHHPCCSSLLQQLHACISTSPAALGKGHGASDQASGVVVSLDRFMCDAPARPAPPGEFQPFLSAHPSTHARPLP